MYLSNVTAYSTTRSRMSLTSRFGIGNMMLGLVIWALRKICIYLGHCRWPKIMRVILKDLKI
jgi:hypothetical protein